MGLIQILVELTGSGKWVQLRKWSTVSQISIWPSKSLLITKYYVPAIIRFFEDNFIVGLYITTQLTGHFKHVLLANHCYILQRFAFNVSKSRQKRSETPIFGWIHDTLHLHECTLYTLTECRTLSSQQSMSHCTCWSMLVRTCVCSYGWALTEFRKRFIKKSTSGKLCFQGTNSFSSYDYGQNSYSK